MFKLNPKKEEGLIMQALSSSSGLGLPPGRRKPPGGRLVAAAAAAVLAGVGAGVVGAGVVGAGVVGAGVVGAGVVGAGGYGEAAVANGEAAVAKRSSLRGGYTTVETGVGATGAIIRPISPSNIDAHKERKLSAIEAGILEDIQIRLIAGSTFDAAKFTAKALGPFSIKDLLTMVANNLMEVASLKSQGESMLNALNQGTSEGIKSGMTIFGGVLGDPGYKDLLAKKMEKDMLLKLLMSATSEILENHINEQRLKDLEGTVAAQGKQVTDLVTALAAQGKQVTALVTAVDAQARALGAQAIDIKMLNILTARQEALQR